MQQAARKTILMQGARDVLGNCKRCDLCYTRKNLIWGGGNIDAPIMVVAGNVNYAEDTSGLVLAGDGGQLLANAMHQVGLRLDRDVFAAPAVKCQRPRVLRDGEMQRADTTPEQRDACKRFLLWQIEIVKPVILIAHGRLAAEVLFGENQPHVAYNGSWRTYGKNTLALATHNPAGLVFGDRRSLQPEFFAAWHGVAERLHCWGRLKRPDAACFQVGWSYTPKEQEIAA